jgi:hypothetical protein
VVGEQDGAASLAVRDLEDVRVVVVVAELAGLGRCGLLAQVEVRESLKSGSPQRMMGCQVNPSGTVKASTALSTGAMAVNCSLDLPKPSFAAFDRPAAEAGSAEVTAEPRTTARAPAAPRPRAARRDIVAEAMSRK